MVFPWFSYGFPMVLWFHQRVIWFFSLAASGFAMPREEAEGADAVLFTLEERHLVGFSKWELEIGAFIMGNMGKIWGNHEE